MKIPYFGEVEPSRLDEWYEVEAVIDSDPVLVELIFESEEVDQATMENVARCLEGVESLVRRARLAILSDWDRGAESEVARPYLEHHLSVMDEREATLAFGSAAPDKMEFLWAARPRRIGISPENEEEFAIIDFQFPPELTQYLIAVAFDADGEISRLSMES